MVAPRHYVYLGTLPLLGLGLLLLAVVPINRGNNNFEHFCIGLLIGTMFGQTTIAAAWTALGPAPLIIRLPLSLLWVVLLLVALGLGLVVHSERQEVAVLMGLSLAAQWIISQVPLWALAIGFGLRLQHRDDVADVHARRQFGIGQLMIFTAIIGVLLGLGRLLLTSGWLRLGQDRELPVFMFLVGTALVMTLPLVFAAFLSRYSLLAVMGTLVFIGLVTLGELPLLYAVVGAAPGPNMAHVVWINTFTTAWVLAFVVVVRISGYQFGAPERVALKSRLG